MELLWSDMSIRKGESGVVVDLLLQIRKAYGHHLRAPSTHGGTTRRTTSRGQRLPATSAHA